MKIYTHTDREHEEHPAGTRIEANVILSGGGYYVGCFRFPESHALTTSEWDLMPKRYATLAKLLMAVERKGFFVDVGSCGI